MTEKKIIKTPFWNREILKQAMQVALKDRRVNHLGQLFPLKPTVLNLLVNDICNSRCRMCLVWKQKKDKEFSPGELELILKNPLFKKLDYISVSGGEPTLREDLPEIFRVIAKKKMLKRGTGIITNALQEDQVIARIDESAQICHREGVKFNVMVSLDGIGGVHDEIRGRKGNYKNAIEVLCYLKDKTNIPVTIGCTVTRDNVWHVDEVLDLCKKLGITGRFRVAEFIDRLYNSNQTRVIRNFSEHERYHLGLFFVKLERLERKHSKRRRTYKNIRKMLLENANRGIRCHWQSTAVTLDSRGQLLYCAPHSPVLGSCLEKSARILYLKNINIRRKILKEYCSNCIHDYGSDETLREWLEEEREKYWRDRFSNDRMAVNVRKENKIKTVPKLTHTPSRFMIIGWYGTETAGDKAILSEIIFQLQDNYPACHITLASIHPYYSKWTLREMKLKNIAIIPTFSPEFLKRVKTVDEVIMGGGPLMHIRALGSVLAAFHEAKQSGKKNRIAGCGIGPLDGGKKFERIVQNILKLADEIELRDYQSIEWAREKTGRNDISNSGDFAAGFVRRWMKQHPVPKPGPFLNLYLREWTTEYKGTLSNEQFTKIKRHFQEKLSDWVHEICAQQDLNVRLLPMHHFCIGNDDRDFNREFGKTYLRDLEPIVESRPLSVHELLTSMQEAALSVCMRFHSVLFANTLGVPFIAIDYTHGGKVSGYLEDYNKSDRMYTLKEIAAGKKISTP